MINSAHLTLNYLFLKFNFYKISDFVARNNLSVHRHCTRITAVFKSLDQLKLLKKMSSEVSQIPPATTKTGDTVVIAMDGSEYSDYALQFYAETIHQPGNNVIIAHAAEYRTVSYPAVAVMSSDTNMSMVTKEIQAEEKKAVELVDKLAAKMRELKLDGTIERIHGEPGPAVITLANDKHADFIVVGCRGKGAVRRTFTGSVTDYIVHHSHVPVMVARHKDHLQHHGLHLPNPFHHHKKHELKTEKSAS